MSGYFTLGGGYTVAEVQVQPEGIYGTGQAHSPILAIGLLMHFYCHKERFKGIAFRGLRAEAELPENRHLSFCEPTSLSLQLAADTSIRDQLVVLRVPLDCAKLTFINSFRKGGDVRLQIRMELEAEELFPLAKTDERMTPIAWGILQRTTMRGDISVNISRAVWVDRVLPGTEFGKVHLIELPTFPLESCKAVKGSFEALLQAQKLETEGYYDEAVSKCRIALEPFFEHVDRPDGKGGTTKVPVLKSSWETKLGKPTYDWLNAAFIATKGGTNHSHHLSSKTFDQMEAKLLIVVTTSLVAYAIRTQSNGK